MEGTSGEKSMAVPEDSMEVTSIGGGKCVEEHLEGTSGGKPMEVPMDSISGVPANPQKLEPLPVEGVLPDGALPVPPASEMMNGLADPPAKVEPPLENGEEEVPKKSDAQVKEEEPAFVTRKSQWAGKPPKAKAKAKAKAKGKAAPKGRPRGTGGRGRGRGKKLDSVVNLLSDEEGEVKMEVEEGDEAEAKKKKAPRKRAPAKRKAAEKPADTNEEEPSGMEEQSQNAEEIVWKPVSQEGIKAWEGKWVCQEPAQDATRSASKKNKLDENGEQRKSPLKSFARRQCPKSSPARERWLVVREFFRMEIKPRIVPCGESTAAWEVRCL